MAEKVLYDISILIVEDEVEINATLEKMLKRRVSKVFNAFNGLEALEIFQSEEIDLVITDVDMPKMNGIDLIENIRLTNKNLPVILLTGLKNLDILVKAIDLQVSLFLQKPISIDKLVEKIEEVAKIKFLEEDIKNKNQLLEQYKSVVDSSAIVSKTDSFGKITYVNEEFCKISGFTTEELLGKSHNIVRHPDMDSKVFESLWKTIKELKKPWNGVIKNKSKNGESYWVKTIISPILNTKNEIIEYIGIRIDITEQELIKQYFENQLQISSENFSHAFQLQKEYEKAMDASNVVSRTDKYGKITYINDRFTKLSGYEKNELIGKSHNIIRHPDTPKELFEEMWNTIKQGKIWEGVLKNRAKHGTPFWASTSIVPIKDENQNIIEHIAIRHDLTELFLLHDEISATQREVIYKMGEIGESRSKETGHHVKRVAEYSKLLAQLYGLDETEAEILFIASPMHDIGKVGIPDSILKKPAKLNQEEWETMKSHTTIGFDILKGSDREVLKAASIVANEHHEKWDGTGYPNGLKGQEIHIFGRITAIADVFDALGSDRCYKKAWDDEKIFTLLQEEKEKHFDPDLIELFFKHLDKFLAIREKISTISECKN